MNIHPLAGNIAATSAVQRAASAEKERELRRRHDAALADAHRVAMVHAPDPADDVGDAPHDDTRHHAPEERHDHDDHDGPQHIDVTA